MAWGDYGVLGDFDNGIDGGLDSQEQGFFDEEFELGILDEEGGVLEYDENAPVELGRKRARSEDELRSEGDMSVEAGRHASVHASDRGSIAGGFDFGKDGDMDMDMGGMDPADQRMDFGDDAGGFDMGNFGDEDVLQRPLDRDTSESLRLPLFHFIWLTALFTQLQLRFPSTATSRSRSDLLPRPPPTSLPRRTTCPTRPRSPSSASR